MSLASGGSMLGTQSTVSSLQVAAIEQSRGAVVGAADLATGLSSPNANGDLSNIRASRFHALRRNLAPKVATAEELLAVRDSLRVDISQAKSEARLQVAGAVDQLNREVQDLRSRVEQDFAEAARDRKRRSAEALAFTEGSHARLQQDLQVAATGLEARLAESLMAVELALQASRMREVVREEAAGRRMGQLSAELSAAAAVRWASLGALLQEQRQALQSEISELAAELASFRHSTEALTFESIESLHLQQVEIDKEQDARLESFQVEMRTNFKGLNTDFYDFKERGERQMQQTAESTSRDVGEIREETQSRLKWLDTQAQTLRGLVAEVENIPTRRVEWLLRNASTRLLELQRPGGRLESPAFETAGGNGFRLELRQSRAEPQAQSGEAGEAEGDCDLFLWACPGLQLIVRLCVGNESVQLQHTFDGRTPCVARRLALLREQVNRQDDTLRIGMEVLEAVREVQLSTAAVTSSDANSAAGEAEEQDAVTTFRYLNHRVLELVQSQVDVMRSRMVRRIEWRLDNASSLRRAFPEGECLCSAPFGAAGMEGLQLVFYPSGYAGVREGFCSYYLYCPAGCMLRCWLSIAKQRREAKVAFERSGFYGRTNFCRFEFCSEPSDDSITLVLEIDEAQQSMTQNLSHMMPPLEARNSASPNSLQASPVLPSSPSPQPQTTALAGSECQSPLPAPEKVGSNLTFRRAPGRNALEDVRQLPCIWTPRPAANLAEALEGYHALSDIKTGRKGSGHNRGVGARAHSSASCRGETSMSMMTPRESSQVPALNPRYLMYAA